jgi:hypothetical protein
MAGYSAILVQSESSMTRAMNFRAWTFKPALLQQYGIVEDVPTSVQNPQANAVCEQMHQVVGNILQTLFYSNPPANLNDVRTMVEYCLATTSYSLCCAANRALGVSPGAVVFHRDMSIDVPYVANLLVLCEKRHAVIDDNL